LIAHSHARPAAAPVWLLVSLILCDALPALAQASATIAEADGIGNVDVNIVYYPDLGCAGCAGKSRLQVPRWRRGHQRATVTSRGRSPRPSFW
jgi:hypothetical protein